MRDISYTGLMGRLPGGGGTHMKPSRVKGFEERKGKLCEQVLGAAWT